MKRTVTGVIPPIGTPLTDHDRVDEAALRRLVRYLVSAGVHGLLANGTMGGFAFLTDDEQVRAISIVVEEVGGAIPVMGGVGETSTSRAIRKAKRTAQEGVTHLSVLPPFYFLAAQEHHVAYFSEIAAAVDLPIFIYDNPFLTKNPIHPETVAELQQKIPSIVGVKESNQDMINLQALLRLTSDRQDFSVLTGSEFLIVVALQMGCSGFIGGLHNICPHMAVDLYTSYNSGNLERAREIQQDLISTWQIFKYGNIWGAFDEALRYLGLAERATGAPYVSRLTSEEKAKVHNILDRYVKPYLDRSVSREETRP